MRLHTLRAQVWGDEDGRAQRPLIPAIHRGEGEHRYYEIPRYQILTTEGILERGGQAVIPGSWLQPRDKGVGKVLASQGESLFDVAGSQPASDPEPFEDE